MVCNRAKNNSKYLGHDIVDIVFNDAMAQLMTAVPGIPDNHCFCGIMPLVNS